MSVKQHPSHTVACRCGAVAFGAVGAPIMSAACYCASCQEAGRQIEQLAGAPPVLDADGATRIVLYRKDRIRCVRGGERLEAHRLKPTSPTRRMVASCCNSAMCLDFTKGHWLSVYAARLTEGAPPVEMRVMTKGRREGVELPADAPSYPGFSGRFMWRLLAAWAAMRFRIPKVEGLPG